MISLLLILLLVSNMISQWFWANRMLAALNHKERGTGIAPVVTYTHPDLVNPNTVGQGDSVIVEPKSPQLVEWEEQEAVRKLNIKPR